MKTTIQIILFTAAILFSAFSAIYAQERGNDEPRISPNASVSQTIGTTVVTVTYGRPSVNERDIFGGLEPYDEVWRAGANEATAITFSGDVAIEGESLPAGTYALFVIPRENNDWTVIFNHTSGQWGAFSYNEGDDVLRVSVTPEKNAPHMEQYMIYFENINERTGTAALHWGSVKIPFRIDV